MLRYAILSAFAKSQKATIRSLMSVCRHGTTRLIEYDI